MGPDGEADARSAASTVPCKCLGTRRAGQMQERRAEATGPREKKGKGDGHLKMKRVRPERQEDLEAAGRTTENNDERKTRSLNRRG